MYLTQCFVGSEMKSKFRFQLGIIIMSIAASTLASSAAAISKSLNLLWERILLARFVSPMKLCCNGLSHKLVKQRTTNAKIIHQLCRELA